ncbi:PEP-CTERM sorting domain-containing protein [Singulisphaera sp. GP187]|uniref:PEP-CTERM sorting domain-containing protein n=1 Tax=Singulisphaera sp. GP187 TaxID=1882752 RepID=UPI0009408F73|nr:PEP-CTERM sorting domain-containing protein [Singulisphaera sp. GP187]
MVVALQSADPRSTPWVQYLLWRQGLNIARFNHYHPVLGPVLEQLPPPVAPPTNPPASGEIIPPIEVHPNGPEPSSIIVALGLAGAGIWWRSRSGRSPTVLAPT